ncbi:MAG: sigma-E factor negative regulatory protein [Chromatiales bacterium]|nr:sigma-E factor negative regulatory protein [Chromatiales bacterium]
MTDNTQQNLSALLDDELSPSEVDHLLEQMNKDQALRQAWGRYHLIGDAIRGEQTQTEVFSIAARVHESLQSEPAIVSKPKPVTQESTKREGNVHWFKPAVGVALAASVAGAAVMIMPDFALNPDSTNQPSQLANTNSVPTVSKSATLQQVAANRPQGYVLSSGTRWKNLSQPEIESKLNRYLINHNELASPAGMTSVLPYASFVSYDSNR